MYYFGNLSTQSDENSWNTGYRTPRKNAVANRQSAAVSSVIGDLPDERFTRTAMDLDSTVEYQVLRRAPQLANRLVNAMNSNNTKDAQEAGDQLDEIGKRYLPYLSEWASLDTRAFPQEGSGKGSIAAKLVNTARYLQSGSWKTSKTDLADFAGADSIEVTYNDFITYDSAQSIANRKSDFVHTWDFDDDTASRLADRVSYDDLKSKALRKLITPYVTNRGKLPDGPEKGSQQRAIESQAHLTQEMWRRLGELQLPGDGQDPSDVNVFNDEKSARDAVRMIEMFNKPPQSGIKSDPPNIRDFQSCAEQYFRPEVMTKYSVEDFVRQWQKLPVDAATTTQVKSAAAEGDTSVHVPVTQIEPRDLSAANVLRGSLVKKGYDIFNSETATMINTVLDNRRKLGFDSSDIGIKISDWAEYVHYQRTMRPSDHTEGVRKLERLVDVHRTLRNLLGFERDMTPQEVQASADNPWIQSINPGPEVFRGFDVQLAESMFPGLTRVMYKLGSGSNDYILTREAVRGVLDGSNNQVIRSLNDAQKRTNLPGDKKAVDNLKNQLADYFYSKLTGIYTDRDGNEMPKDVFRDFRTYSDVVMRKTHTINAEGKVVSNLKELPRVEYVWGDKKSFITQLAGIKNAAGESKKTPSLNQILGESDEHKWGKGLSDSLNEFLDVIIADPHDATRDSDYKDDHVDTAGAKLLVEKMAFDTGYSLERNIRPSFRTPEFYKLLGKAMRGQIVLSDNRMKDRDEKSWIDSTSTWFGWTNSDIGINDDVPFGDVLYNKRCYQDIFDFCLELARPSKGENTGSKEYVTRLSFAQDLAAQTFISMLLIDDTGAETEIFNRSVARYDRLKNGLGDSFARFVKQYSKVRSMDGTTIGWFTNDIDEDANHIQILKDFQRERDADLKALSGGTYTTGFLTDHYITLGRSEFDPIWALSAMNAKAVATHQEQVKENRYKVSQGGGASQRIWGRVVNDIIDPDNVTAQAVQQIMRNSPGMERMLGSAMDVKYYNEMMAGQIGTLVQKLRSGDPSLDKGKIASMIIDIANRTKPVFWASGEGSGSAIQFNVTDDMEKFFDRLPKDVKSKYDDFNAFCLHQSSLAMKYQEQQRLMRELANADARRGSPEPPSSDE